MATIPKFKNEQEEAKFWETHDTVDFWDDTEEANEKLELSAELAKTIKNRKARKRPLTLRLEQRQIDIARAIAYKKGIGYQTLMRMWITEGISRESPE